MADNSQALVGPELQALPLQLIITGAMNGIVSAQAISAKTTSDFLQSTKGDITFSAKMDNGGVVKDMNITVPQIAVVPIPSLRVDSATIHFNFEIKQFSTVTNSTDFNANLNVGTTGWLKNLVSASLSGSVTHKNSSENTVNRSGMLDITIHLSEPPIPEGLSKVLNLLSNSILVTDGTQPAGAGGGAAAGGAAAGGGAAPAGGGGQ